MTSLKSLLFAALILAPGQSAPAASPARKPVLVLTNRDLPAAASARNVLRIPDARPVGSELSVEFWAALKASGIGDVEIRGIVRNPGAATVRISSIEVEIKGPDGRTLSQKAFPRKPLLDAGGSTSFRARFPDLGEEHGDPTFTVFIDDAPVTSRGAPARTEDSRVLDVN